MTFGNNQIQFNIVKDIYKHTLYRTIMKWRTEIDNDNQAALYITDNNIEEDREGLLLYNKNTNNILHNQQYITQQTNNNHNQHNKTNNTTQTKKTTIQYIEGDRMDFEFYRGGKKW